MDGQRLAIRTQHLHLQGAWAIVHIARLEHDLAELLEVDGVVGRTANDVLPVHEKALPLGELLAIGAQWHDEAEALLRVPFLHSALVPRVLLLGRLGRLRLHAWSLLRMNLIQGGGRSLAFLGSRFLVELDKLGGLDGLPHFLGLLHLPHHRVIVVIYLPKDLRVALLGYVVDPRFDVQVETGLRVVLPLAHLLVDVPTAAIWRRLIVPKLCGRDPLNRPGAPPGCRPRPRGRRTPGPGAGALSGALARRPLLLAR
mmetsp:Transcript_9827/g.21990  ORF Transcript_9827/g.21990 Transcript_9827/m.21990 type:complete len:256 (-) Transcript_9827:93-860(-)